MKEPDAKGSDMGRQLKERIFAATRQQQSDLVYTDIYVVDVFNQEVFTADVAIHEGLFVGVGEYKGSGKKEIDGRGLYMIPGLIDAHVHIESTLVTPVEYSNASLLHGVTGVVADPHEIANVCGIDGIEFVLENSRHVPLDVHLMLPSCVPATSFENAGSVLKAEDLRPLYDRDGVRGLAEVMDFPAVLSGDTDMLQKLEDAEAAGVRIDGHGAGFTLDQLNGYAAANIRTDHECDSAEGLTERVRRGIYTLVREGTVCRDLLKMLPAVNEKNARYCCFATDDKHLDDLLTRGGVDNNIRLAIAGGLAPATAIQMGSLNAAQCYKLDNVGAIAPGYVADYSIVTDLEQLIIRDVFKNGIQVVQDGELVERVDPQKYKPAEQILTSVHIPRLDREQLAIEMQGAKLANIIEIVPGTVVSNRLVAEVDVVDGRFAINTERDQLKIAVIERHKRLGNVATGVVTGLRMRQGAIATTIAHDSHNLIVAGASEEEMLRAIEEIERMQGGIVVVSGNEVRAALALEVGGIMTCRPAEQVVADLNALQKAWSKLAPDCEFNPFLALSFMSLVVIPHLKLCDSGLFDFSSFSFIEVPVQD